MNNFGVDRLFVDEAHYYKNLFLQSKMKRVAGVQSGEAQKSSDMFMKCQYMDEITGGKGIVFATGTPISNSMTELYTMQRYLQYNTLVKNYAILYPYPEGRKGFFREFQGGLTLNETNH